MSAPVRARILAVFAAVTILFAPWNAQLASQTSGSEPDVDLVLVLAVDCSYSVDSDEFELQMQGLARAFKSAEVVEAIQAGPRGRIAVSVVQWSSWQSQQIAVPWTLISDAASSLRFAAAIDNAPRLTAEGATSIRAAIDFSTAYLFRSPFRGARNVIDISTDGRNNSGGKPEPARDRAVATGITINGLTILNEIFYLDLYFSNRIAGGPGHFVMKANDYQAYLQAIKRKLLKEIKGPPIS